MSAKLKRFTFKAIMFALMSLVFYGCSSTTTPEAPVQKAVAGVVSGSNGAQPLANAEIIAYAIDATVAKVAGKNVQKGVVGKVPFPGFVPVRSDGRGKFEFKIPESYKGGLLLEAKEPGNIVPLRTAMPPVSENKVYSAIISPATEMVCKYVETNKAGSFTAENIQKAVLVLEPLYGPGFNEVPPVVVGTVPTKAQQQLAVMTQAVKLLVDSGIPASTLLKAEAATGTAPATIAMGGTQFSALTNALKVSVVNSITHGTIVPADFKVGTSMITDMTTQVAAKINSGDIKLGNYTLTGPSTPSAPPLPVITLTTAPVMSEPDLTDVTAPSAPQNLNATVTSASVTLTWDAASDATGVVKYFIYRDGSFLSDTSATQLTYTDNNVEPGKAYLYDVKARDAAGNISVASSKSVTTAPVLKYTISGKVTTSAGAPIPSVIVVISGAGSGMYLTDASGNYTIADVRAGNYFVTPTLSGYIFTPVNKEVTVTAGNITGVDFAAVNTGNVSGEVTYPPGTIIGGISYPLGTVIGGITYPTATVIGGVTYPTGVVIGGVTYPSGVIIGGVSYPAGTIVGGVAFPVGALTAGVTYPTGVVIGGVTYPSGTVNAGITYPNGSVIGVVSYSGGTLFGGVTYPGAMINGGVAYPTGSVAGIVTYPNGALIGGLSYPNGMLATSGVIYPTGAVIGSISYPTGSITAMISGTVSYSIYGRVTIGGAALSGVKVDLAYAASPLTIIATTTTVFTGEYVLENVASGSYSIKASKTGYTLSAPLSVTIDKSNITEAILTATQP